MPHGEPPGGSCESSIIIRMIVFIHTYARLGKQRLLSSRVLLTTAVHWPLLIADALGTVTCSAMGGSPYYTALFKADPF